MSIQDAEKNAINTLASFFNKKNNKKFFWGSASNNKKVLKRIMIVAKHLFPNLCDVVIPKDTIFVRTCKGNKSGGGGCYYEAFFNSTTTYCNLSPLSNLNIQNRGSTKTNKNDHVIFLKTKKELKFFNFNVISQLIGVQVKMGEEPGHKVGEGRGFFGACCIIKDIENICNSLDYVGVVQCDIADAYYLKAEHNDNEDLLPFSMQNNSIPRQFANQLVIQAIQEKKAFPIYDDLDNFGMVIGAMFPEFNIHLKGQTMQNLFDLVMSKEHDNDIHLLSIKFSQGLPEKGGIEPLDEDIGLNFLTDLLVDSDVTNYIHKHGNKIVHGFKYSWDLDLLCKNSYEDYFLINFNKYTINQNNNDEWIGRNPNDPDPSNFYINDTIRSRGLRLFVDSSNNLIYTALPYFSINEYNQNTQKLIEFTDFMVGSKQNVVQFPAMALQPPSFTAQTPTTFQPSVMQPSVNQPSVMQPNVMQPSVMQTSVMQPSVNQPSGMQPSVNQPSVMQTSVMHAKPAYGGGNKKKKKKKELKEKNKETKKIQKRKNIL